LKIDLGEFGLTDKEVVAGEVRPGDDDKVEESSLKDDPSDEAGTISGSISSSSSLLELICVSSLQDLAFINFFELYVFNWGSNALTYLDVGRFHMLALVCGVRYESSWGEAGGLIYFSGWDRNEKPDVSRNLLILRSTVMLLWCTYRLAQDLVNYSAAANNEHNKCTTEPNSQLQWPHQAMTYLNRTSVLLLLYVC
jgi:hypothetical protein